MPSRRPRSAFTLSLLLGLASLGLVACGEPGMLAPPTETPGAASPGSTASSNDPSADAPASDDPAAGDSTSSPAPASPSGGDGTGDDGELQLLVAAGDPQQIGGASVAGSPVCGVVGSPEASALEGIGGELVGSDAVENCLSPLETGQAVAVTGSPSELAAQVAAHPGEYALVTPAG